jgi:hypothetical protein
MSAMMPPGLNRYRQVVAAAIAWSMAGFGPVLGALHGCHHQLRKTAP